MSNMITVSIPGCEEFYSDLLGYFQNELGLFSFIGRKQGIDRALVLLHQGASVRQASHSFETQPDLFRVFRIPLARGVQKVFLIPKDTPKKVKKPAEDSQEQNASDSVDDPSISQGQSAQIAKEGAYDPLTEVGIQFLSCWRGQSREGLWARIIRESPIPLQPQWGTKLVPLFVHHERLDELRQENGYAPRGVSRLKKMQFATGAEGDGLWAGASVDLDGVDIAVAAREGLNRKHIFFEKEPA